MIAYPLGYNISWDFEPCPNCGKHISLRYAKVVFYEANKEKYPFLTDPDTKQKKAKWKNKTKKKRSTRTSPNGSKLL